MLILGCQHNFIHPLSNGSNQAIPLMDYSPFHFFMLNIWIPTVFSKQINTFRKKKWPRTASKPSSSCTPFHPDRVPNRTDLTPRDWPDCPGKSSNGHSKSQSSLKKSKTIYLRWQKLSTRTSCKNYQRALIAKIINAH